MPGQTLVRMQVMVQILRQIGGQIASHANKLFEPGGE
jgi:hypothetical protein